MCLSKNESHTVPTTVNDEIEKWDSWEDYCNACGVIEVDKNTGRAFEYMGKWYKTVRPEDEKSFSFFKGGTSVVHIARNDIIKENGGWEKYCKKYGVIEVDKNTKGCFEYMGKWYITTLSISDDGPTAKGWRLIEVDKNTEGAFEHMGKWVIKETKEPV